MVEQISIEKSIQSSIATYTNIFDEIQIKENLKRITGRYL
ncbi:hypothetical protein QC3_0810 [Clostridioides difficile CD22]|nr:hypothetical protein QC3_0810 [Clostridioides difficile CD22]